MKILEEFYDNHVQYVTVGDTVMITSDSEYTYEDFQVTTIIQNNYNEIWLYSETHHTWFNSNELEKLRI